MLGLCGDLNFLADSRHGNLNFRRVIYVRFRSGFCFWSDFYTRDSGGTKGGGVKYTWGLG